MKCISCNNKLNIRNIHRLCKSDQTHVYCSECAKNILEEESKNKNIILCKKCDSVIYEKKENNDKSNIDNKEKNLNSFILGSLLTISHMNTICQKI